MYLAYLNICLYPVPPLSRKLSESKSTALSTGSGALSTVEGRKVERKGESLTCRGLGTRRSAWQEEDGAELCGPGGGRGTPSTALMGNHGVCEQGTDVNRPAAPWASYGKGKIPLTVGHAGFGGGSLVGKLDSTRIQVYDL